MSLDTATSSLFPQPVPQPVLVSRHSQPADNIPKKIGDCTLQYNELDDDDDDDDDDSSQSSQRYMIGNISPTIKSAIGSAGGALDTNKG
uniref:Uncharacterized protein n=1 Tax=Rhizophagus irregularis (strain DAOM 181602 / DAOM 197198 / MUCL 43194) TaxID=747089 RepID=U9TCN5_RHIID